MIKPFKFFKGKIYTDEYTVEPPFNLSRRHWNMLPQDLRGETLQEIECYIQGWEDGCIVGVVNPYRDRTRRNLWNRGFLRWRGRIG